MKEIKSKIKILDMWITEYEKLAENTEEKWKEIKTIKYNIKLFYLITPTVKLN